MSACVYACMCLAVLGFSRDTRVFSCGTRDFLAVACKLLLAACGIWFPDQGSNPGPLHWEHGVLATGPSGKSTNEVLKKSVMDIFPLGGSKFMLTAGPALGQDCSPGHVLPT